MRWLAVWIFAPLLAVSVYAEEATTPSSIKTIAIIRVPQPMDIVAIDKGSLGVALGGLGAGAVALDAHLNKKGLLGAIARSKFSFPDQLTQDLNEALLARGFKTQLVDADRKGRPDKLLDDYAAILPSDADAVLDVSLIMLGYSTEHYLFSPHWRPEASVWVALIPRTAAEPVYKERIMYGWHNVFMSAAKLPAPKEYQFANREAMDQADDATLVGGLKDASKAIAAHVASKLPAAAK